MSEKEKPRPGEIPAKPGVYVFRNRFGEVIYVGKAVNLRKRVSQYFQQSRNKSEDPKLRSLINSIDKWEYYTVKNEDESLILESRLIKEYAPKYNVLLRDDKRYFLVKINTNEKFPRIQLARVRKDDQSRYFGPFPKGGVLKDTVEFLTRYFGIRSCKGTDPSEKDHKHCVASVIKDCCAPCIGKVTEEEYKEQIDSLLEVLGGKTSAILKELKDKMQEASIKMKFELAAKYRDMCSNIEELYGAKNRSFRYSHIPSSPGNGAVLALQKILGLKNPPNVIEGFDNSNIGGQMAVSSMVCFKSGKPFKQNYRRFKIRNVMQADDFATMKEVIERHYGRKIREQLPFPDLILIDGGKGQLNAALQALIDIDSPPLPVIGLAKKNEEVYIPGRSEPVIIDKHSPALKLLQAIRDEAHRFAVNYHRDLRSKRLQESLLDEIDGIGPARKISILKAFGSVKALRKASPEEIAKKVPGVALKFAKVIHDHLKI